VLKPEGTVGPPAIGYPLPLGGGGPFPNTGAGVPTWGLADCCACRAGANNKPAVRIIVRNCSLTLICDFSWFWNYWKEPGPLFQVVPQNATTHSRVFKVNYQVCTIVHTLVNNYRMCLQSGKPCTKQRTHTGSRTYFTGALRAATSSRKVAASST